MSEENVFNWFQFGALKEWLLEHNVRVYLIENYGVTGEEIDRVTEVIGKIESKMVKP